MRNYFYSVMTDTRRGWLASGVKAILFIFSLFYGILAQGTRLAYQIGILPSCRLSRPVISVGNITFGGVGKTPCVIMISKFLQNKNIKPAILTRGYKGQRTGSGDNQKISDEGLLFRKLLDGIPIIIGKNRVQGALRSLKDDNPEIFILDDGFQHWRIKRDLDIVLIDATNPFGNGRLLPRGILREPVDSLSRAHVVIITKANLAKENLPMIKEILKSVNPAIPIYEAVHQPTTLIDWKAQKEIPFEQLRAKRVGCFSSIGNPVSFHASLESMDISISQRYVFPDHYWYSKNDINRLQSALENGENDVLVTTMKDAVKIDMTEVKDLPFIVLNMEMRMTQGQDEINNRITHLLHS